MKPHNLRTFGIALLFGAVQLCNAQSGQNGTGSPNNAYGITITSMTVGGPGCGNNPNYQVVANGEPWNQSYGDTTTFFTLPAGTEGDQTYQLVVMVSMDLNLLSGMQLQSWVRDTWVTQHAVDVLSINSISQSSFLMNLNMHYPAGNGWETNGVREFGLVMRFPTYPYEIAVRFKAVMVGESFTEVLGHYNAPALPLFILRDPPGDQSFSSLTTGNNTCFGTTRSATAGDEQGGYFKTKLGVAGETGFIVTTAFEFSVEVGVSINATQTQTSDFEYKTCMQVTNEFTTSDDGTPDDVFIGNAVRYKYGMARVIGRPSCGTITKDAYFLSAPESTLMDYNYTESFIRTSVIPDLEEQIALLPPGTPAYKNAVVQRGVWIRTLELNDQIKSAGQPATVRSFSGGGIGTQYTQTTTTTGSAEIDYEVTLENGLSADMSLEIGGAGISAGGSLKMRSGYGIGNTQSNEVTNTMSYTLKDNDVFDNHTVEVRNDPYFGTYAFLLDSATSRTSCRYEGGYQLDQPSLSVGTPGNSSMTVNQAPIGQAVNFPLIICNDSEFPRTYHLRFSAASNAQGAILQAFGNTLNSNDNGIQLELQGGECINSTLSLTQPNPGVVDFSNINLYLYALCEEEYAPFIRSYISISAYFGDGNIGNLCEPASANGTAEGDFVDGVQLGSINNTGTGATNGSAYTNYSSQFTTTLSHNGQYMVSITSGQHFDNTFSVWIDYDQDGSFEASERVGSFTSTESFSTTDISFVVPATAALGNTRMRVRASYLPGSNPASMDPCIAYDYGETEDYGIVINSNVPVDCAGVAGGNANPGTACNDNDPLTGNDAWNANCNCLGVPVDCTGVPGGNNLPGTACDDGDPNTAGDAYNANCQCVGQVIDCAGLPGGSTLPGTACNDGNPATGNDTWTANCQCVGQVIDCVGVPGGNALPGTACNDGNPLSTNDVYGANCQCAGTLPADCTGVPGGSAQPGTPCDDNNTATGNDTYGANCLCAGLPFDCAGTPGGTLLPGTPCNDGNPNTVNDVFSANCTCSGTLVANDCAGVPGGSAQPGTACNDGNPNTGNDTWNAFCQCAGQLIDCTGVPGGLNLPGAPCNDGNPNTGNDVYGTDCACAGVALDCLGQPGGSAAVGSPCDDGNPNTSNDVYTANCICAGVQANDCLGVPGGSAQPGTPCNDGNPDTGNDLYGADCTCVGQLIDCVGNTGGTSLPGTSCNDGDPCTSNDVYDASCNCSGSPLQLSVVAGYDVVYTETTSTFSITPVAGATGYSWTLPNGWSSSNTNAFVLVAEVGTLVGPATLCVDVQVGACALNICRTVAVELSTGIGNTSVTTEPWLQLQPNPSNGQFQLVRNDDGTPMQVTIHDGIGRIVKSTFQVIGNGATTIDLGGVESGTYYLIATRDDQQRIVPFVVTR